MARNPMQPVIKADDGIVRFKANKIVEFLCEWASTRGMSMNDLAKMPFDNDDRTQFAQLIGYSVSGAGDLSYFDRDVLDDADWIAESLAGPDA